MAVKVAACKIIFAAFEIIQRHIMKYAPRVRLHEGQNAKKVQSLPRVNMSRIKNKKINISADSFNVARDISAPVERPFVFKLREFFIDKIA